MESKPFGWPHSKEAALPTFSTHLEKITHRPYTGVTQGGSSRKDAGCKSAASLANQKPWKGPNAPVSP